jgi:hypothetical protein
MASSTNALSATASPGSTVYAIYTSATEYDLYWPTTKDRWWKSGFTQIAPAATSVGSTPNNESVPFKIGQGSSIVFMAKVYEETDASFVYNIPANWGSVSGTTYHGGSYRRSNTTGDYYTWTSPVSSTAVAAYWPMLSNLGIAKVSIDGDATAANRLKTAQDLVTAGSLASTALVANGGTLNPTDRVWDGYSATTISSAFILLADGLANAAHVVKVTVSGYKNTASTDTRVPADAMAAVGGSVLPGGSGVTEVNMVRSVLFTATPQWEYAYQLDTRSTLGHSGGTWSGGWHGYDTTLTAPTVKVNGSVVTPTVGQVLSGTSIEFDQTNRLWTPNITTAPVASIAQQIILTTDGLRSAHTDTWSFTGVLYCYVAYPAMASGFAIDPGGMIDTGSGDDSGVTTVSLAAADDLHETVGESATIWEWDSSATGVLVLLAKTNMSLSTELNGYTQQDSDKNFIWREIGSPADKKIYYQRVGAQIAAPVALTSGDVWNADFTIRLAHVDNANATLTAVSGGGSASFSDSVLLSTSLAATAGAKVRGTSDSVPVSTALVRTASAKQRTTSDTVPVSTSLARVAGAQSRGVADSVPVASSVAAQKVLPRSTSDTVPVESSLARSAAVKVRGLADSTPLATTLTRAALAKARALANTVGVATGLGAVFHPATPTTADVPGKVAISVTPTASVAITVTPTASVAISVTPTASVAITLT